ncbi:MAG TPA: hypothetical protein VEB59_06750, partial [Gemmatimonadales bacterium]|nr:hypothetical protein [Gemmatimonadales bacterium]
RQQHLDRLGIYPDVSTDPSAPASAEDPAVLLLHRRDVPLDMPVRVILDGIEASSITAGPNEALRTYYALERRSLRSFARLLSRDEVRDWSLWHNELATVLAGLLVAAVCFNEGPKARLRALGLGYIVVARDHAIHLYSFLHPAVEGVLRTMLGGGAPPVPPTGEAWLAALASLPPDPLRLALGPCLLESTDDWAILDWAGLSLRFGQVLEYPRLAGEIANVRARAFEEALQEAIDQTPWAPPPELRRLAGRDLKQGGRVIGEVDAVAHEDGRTLLVSAKSISVGDAYVAGDYNARREAAQKVLAALSRWDALLADLSADPAPEGANYDLRSAGDLIGVVVTPNALPIPLDAAVRTTAVPGVLAYMSVHELLERLRAN